MSRLRCSKAAPIHTLALDLDEKIATAIDQALMLDVSKRATLRLLS